MEPDAEVLTPQEVADILRIAKNTVYELVKREELPYYRVGKKLRFQRSQIEAYLRGTALSPGNAHVNVSAEDPQTRNSTAAPQREATLQHAKRSGIVLCGQDILLDVLVQYLGTAISGARITRSFTGSYSGLIDLYRGEVDMTSCHLWDADSDSYNTPFLKHLLPGIPLTVIRLASRSVGFYVKTGNAFNIGSWNDFGRTDITFLNRELGSGVRALVDGKLKQHGISPAVVPGYSRCCTSHLVAATTIIRGGADYAIGNEMTARQVTGIEFIPLQEEKLDLIFPSSREQEPLFAAVLEHLSSPGFRQQVESFGVYDASQTGHIVRT